MLSSRLLLNLSLLLLVIVLATFVFIGNKESKPVSMFSELKYKDITHIQIRYNNTDTVLEKSNTDWHILQPIKIQADTFRVQAILNILNIKNPASYTVNTGDYKKYELDPPHAELILNQQHFIFGATSAVDQKRYIVTNQRLFLTDDRIFPLISAGYRNLMRRQLFNSQLKIQQITFDNTDVFLNKSGSWDANIGLTSADHLKLFVDNWLHIQAFSVSTANKPYAGIKVTIKTVDQKTLTRYINQTDYNTVIIDPDLGLSYQFDKKAFDSLTNINYYSPENSVTQH